jgi:hypothetical protein
MLLPDHAVHSTSVAAIVIVPPPGDRRDSGSTNADGRGRRTAISRDASCAVGISEVACADQGPCRISEEFQTVTAGTCLAKLRLWQNIPNEIAE